MSPKRARSDRRCTKHENERILAFSRKKLNSHRNERDPKIVQACDCMVEGMLIRINWYYLYQQDTSSFR